MIKNQIIHEQYKVSKCYMDLVLPEHKVSIEIDENGHTDRPKNKEKNK